MVIAPSASRRAGAFLNVELIAALGVLLVAMLPMAYAIMQELKLARRCYHDAVAMQLLDGEMEIMAAGNWRALNDGEHVLRVTAPAVTNLPPGKFVAVRDGQRVRVEWRPEKAGRAMWREVKLP